MWLSALLASLQFFLAAESKVTARHFGQLTIKEEGKSLEAHIIIQKDGRMSHSASGKYL